MRIEWIRIEELCWNYYSCCIFRKFWYFGFIFLNSLFL